MDCLFKEIPGGFGRLDVTPAVSTCTRVEVIEVEPEHDLLHVFRDCLDIDVGNRRLGKVLCLAQRSGTEHPLGAVESADGYFTSRPFVSGR